MRLPHRALHQSLHLAIIVFTVLSSLAAHVQAQEQPDRNGFIRIFDGKTLSGWTLVGGQGPGYVPIEGGILDCPADGGGNLFTVKEYSDFVFRF